MKQHLLGMLFMVAGTANALNVNVGKVSSLTVNGDLANLVIVGGQIKPELTIVKKGTVEVETQEKNGQLFISVKNPKRLNTSFGKLHLCTNECEADIYIKLPTLSKMDINLEYGDIKISHFTGNSQIKLGTGDLTFQYSTLLDSKITLNDGDFIAKHLTGKMNFALDTGDFHATALKITKESHIQNQTGDIKVSGLHLAHHATFTNDTGDIQLDSVTGPVRQMKAISEVGEATYFQKGQKMAQAETFTVLSNAAKGFYLTAKTETGDIFIQQAQKAAVKIHQASSED